MAPFSREREYLYRQGYLFLNLFDPHLPGDFYQIFRRMSGYFLENGRSQRSGQLKERFSPAVAPDFEL